MIETRQSAATEIQFIGQRWFPVSRPRWTATSFLIADFLALSFAFWFCVFCRRILGGEIDLEIYLRISPLALLFLIAFGTAGLYPGIGLNPVEELRRICLTASLVHLFMGTATFLIRDGEKYSRAVFLAAWLLTLILVPLSRTICRIICCRLPGWGCSTVIIGGGEMARRVAEFLRAKPEFGLKAALAILDDPSESREIAMDMPVLTHADDAIGFARELGISHAILAMPESPRNVGEMLERYGHAFSHLLIVFDLPGFYSHWLSPKDMDGILGLEVQQKLLMLTSRVAKRILDCVLTIVGGIVIVPLLGLIALAIQLDNPGPVFYGQTRIGKGGRTFIAWKFRSMIQNADEELERYLSAHPELREEWEMNHKLKDDPRVTRVGRFLRRSSFDELPQFWNFFKEESGWVGPRPIVSKEVSRYGNHYPAYTRVTPGITGLWQVSGRNDTSYAERVEFDAYYVRNWSVWLDLYLLFRTVSVVLAGKGAY